MTRQNVQKSTTRLETKKNEQKSLIAPNLNSKILTIFFFLYRNDVTQNTETTASLTEIKITPFLQKSSSFVP